MKKKKTGFDYEQAMTRLEEIINQFDEGELNLDEMEQSFSEGMQLIQQCAERLDRMETRVNQLMDQASMSTEPLDPEDPDA